MVRSAGLSNSKETTHTLCRYRPCHLLHRTMGRLIKSRPDSLVAHIHDVLVAAIGLH